MRVIFCVIDIFFVILGCGGEDLFGEVVLLKSEVLWETRREPGAGAWPGGVRNTRMQH